MGLFADKIHTYVSSTVYNLAGDEKDRPNVLQSAVVGSVLRGVDSIAGTLQSSLLNGTGMKQRAFFRWARSNYALGMPSGSLGASEVIDADVAVSGLKAALSLSEAQTPQVLSAEIDDADIGYWAENWILRNRPDLGEEDWSAEYDQANGEIVIQLLEEPLVRLAATPDFLWGRERMGRKLLYIAYRTITDSPDTPRASESPIELFTYRMGSGNVVFDALNAGTEEIDEFFPAMPLRLWNTSIRDEGQEDVYTAVKKGYRRLTGASLDQILDQVEDNENLDDIDFCFLVQGVNLNTAETAGQDYLYRFLRSLMDQQKHNATDFGAYFNKAMAWGQTAMSTQRWRDANVGGLYTHPMYGKAFPAQQYGAPSAPAMNELRISSTDQPEFDIRLRWRYVIETQHLGNARTFDGDTSREKLKPGQFWMHVPAPLHLTVEDTAQRSRGERHWITREYSRLWVFHQYAPLRYRRLEIMDLQHLNYVYKDHAVITSPQKALEAEDDSGFLVPLHYPTLLDMGLAKGTQLSTVSSYLVFNSYERVRQKWYQQGWFRIVLVVASIALAVVTSGASLAASGGILGGNVALGMFLGATTVATAAIVGAIANAIAAMIVTSLITKAATRLFGEKWGAIIGTIASFVAMQYGAQYATTGNFNVDWGQLMRAENILKVTNSVSNAYTRWINADTADIYAQMDEVSENYSDKMQEIEELSDEILGMTNGLIDPMMFTDATEYFGESSDAFLGRTLLTGSDIAELTHAMIEDFPALSLELPKAVR